MMAQGLCVMFNASPFLTCWSDGGDVVRVMAASVMATLGVGLIWKKTQQQQQQLRDRSEQRKPALPTPPSESRWSSLATSLLHGKIRPQLSHCHFVWMTADKFSKWNKGQRALRWGYWEKVSPAHYSKPRHWEVMSQKPAVASNNQTCTALHFLPWIRSSCKSQAWADNATI